MGAGPGLPGQVGVSQDKSAELQRRIVESKHLFDPHNPPQNETYRLLFGKHQRGNTAVEIKPFRPLIDQADRQIRKIAGR